MAMIHTSPEVQQLQQLLQDKFGLTQGGIEFTLSCGRVDLVKINATYSPCSEADA